MGWKMKLLTALAGLSGYEQYKADLKRKGEDMSLESAYKFFGKPAVDKIMNTAKGGMEYFTKKNEGGMMQARKKNMGLKYKKGGSVKKPSKKSRGTGAAKRGTKFKGTF
jgi:hypothetical protein